MSSKVQSGLCSVTAILKSKGLTPFPSAQNISTMKRCARGAKTLTCRELGGRIQTRLQSLNRLRDGATANRIFWRYLRSRFKSRGRKALVLLIRIFRAVECWNWIIRNTRSWVKAAAKTNSWNQNLQKNLSQPSPSKLWNGNLKLFTANTS